MNWLIDANIPKGISEWQGEDFEYVYEWGDYITDQAIWNHALKFNKIIITRDADFMFKMLRSDEFPKVIYMDLQEMSKKTFKDYVLLNWEDIKRQILLNDIIVTTIWNIQAYRKS